MYNLRSYGGSHPTSGSWDGPRLRIIRSHPTVIARPSLQLRTKRQEVDMLRPKSRTLLVTGVLVAASLLLLALSDPVRHSSVDPLATAVEDGIVSSSAHLLVIYSYYYSNPPLHPDEENLLFFSHHGIYYDDPRVTYLLLFATDDIPISMAEFGESRLAKGLPKRWFYATNVHVSWVTNGIYDLCNYKNAFSRPLFRQLAAKATFFFFLNATVRGPFLPLYLRHLPWWVPFFDLMTESVSLVGPYVNCEIAPHVQSFAFLLDRSGLNIAKLTWQCPSPAVRTDPQLRMKWIGENEVALSRNIIKANRSFKVLLAAFYGIDGRKLGTSEPCVMANPTYKTQYFESHPTPYEVIFYKCGGDIHRGQGIPSISSHLLEIYTDAAQRTKTME